MIQNKQINCFLCGHLMRKELRDMTDNRFGSKGTYNIVKCHNCGLLRT